MPDLFISYSRKNLVFVEKLVSALEGEGKVVWWDQKKEALEGIIVGSPWWEQIKFGIEEADNFLFVISPNSIVSPYCHAEINYARRHDKRLVTALYCGWISEQETWEAIGAAIDAIPAEDELPDEVTREPVNFRSLVRQNWLSLNEIQHAIFSSSTSFDDPFKLLVKALDLDLAWVRMYNRLRQAALLWDENSHSDDFLWSSGQLAPVYEMVERRQPELDELVKAFIRPEIERLWEEVENPETDHFRRAEIGDRLARLDEQRPGVRLGVDGYPDIVWCSVPEGKIEIQSQVFTVNSFYIAKYPVTYWQYQAFLQALDGWENDEWWTGLARHGIYDWRQNRKIGNCPAENITWYEAVAFTRWLNTKLPRKGWPDKAGAGWMIRLPTEWEWQWAATSDQEYPWNGWWDSVRCNTYESGLSRTTAVGLYPQGASPVGALDVAGNIWEWCLNEYDTLEVDLSTYEDCVLRGGSYNTHKDSAQIYYRNWNSPASKNDDLGFRLVCSANGIESR